MYTVFYNESNYHYHFMINELASKFECLGKNTENYRIFFILIEKEVRKVNKDGNEHIMTNSYKI